jgi:hypothetical protein
MIEAILDFDNSMKFVTRTGELQGQWGETSLNGHPSRVVRGAYLDDSRPVFRGNIVCILVGHGRMASYKPATVHSSGLKLTSAFLQSDRFSSPLCLQPASLFLRRSNKFCLTDNVR